MFPAFYCGDRVNFTLTYPDYSPEVYALIQKHGINEPRRISPRYRGQ